MLVVSVCRCVYVICVGVYTNTSVLLDGQLFCSVIDSIWYVLSDVDGGDEQGETAVLEIRDGMWQARKCEQSAWGHYYIWSSVLWPQS